MKDELENGNFISRFANNARIQADKTALIIPQMNGTDCTGEESISYGELGNTVSQYQALWSDKGWQSGDKIIVIVKPGIALYAIALSLLGMGIIPVFIDTGMGRKKIRMALQDANAKAIISMSALLKFFWLIPEMWRLQRLSVDGKGIGYSCLQSQLSQQTGSASIIALPRDNDDHGLISFTSGSTGRPKGADRTHDSLIQQHLAIRSHWQDEADDIDCPCFPVVVLHNLSCGMTTVMPKVDLANPAGVDAEQVIEQIRSHKVTRLSGAPAYMTGLVNYLLANQQTLSEVRSLVVGGATVSLELAKGIQQVFPEAHSRIVYGSTEAEPIASLDIDDYLNEYDQHAGYLVGEIAHQVELAIVESGTMLETEQQVAAAMLDEGSTGEILVSGRHVLKQYLDNPLANKENKIPRADGSVWHRTGDTGFLDQQQRIWLTGRVKDALSISGRIIQPFPLEQKIDALAEVRRSALMVHGNRLNLFIELEMAKPLTPSIQQQITQVLKSTSESSIEVIQLEKMPVDGRHNSKIDRPELLAQLQKNVSAQVWKL
jgi:acyl-CoA synthetase (AMP-forming)/AMP-acid ligase II